MNINKVKNIEGQVGEGVGFERIRRITGYLTGTTDRWCESKVSELNDRVKHSLNHDESTGRNPKNFLKDDAHNRSEDRER